MFRDLQDVRVFARRKNSSLPNRQTGQNEKNEHVCHFENLSVKLSAERFRTHGRGREKSRVEL